MEDKLELTAPWIGMANLINGFFRDDDEVFVEYDPEEVAVTLHVDNPFKADALSQVLPEAYEFGNARLVVKVIPDNEDVSHAQLIQMALAGNPIACDSGTVVDGSLSYPFLMLSPFVIQYFNDEVRHPYGVRTVLPEQAAREIFADVDDVSFVTCPVEDDIEMDIAF